MKYSQAHKTHFAEMWLRTNDAYQAALIVCDNCIPDAVMMAASWPADDFVLREKKRLLDERGVAGFLPSKDEVLKTLWEHAQASRGDEKTKAIELYMKGSGILGKVETKPADYDGIPTNSEYVLTPDEAGPKNAIL